MEPIHFHVLVPVYRAEKYLDACVRSVLDQTYQNFELILVDDGSPDRSGELCDRWAERDGRVRVFHVPNGGPLKARIFAIQQAGKDGFGVFLDSDDTLRPNALETIADTILKYDCDCVVYGMERALDGKVLFRSKPLGDGPVLMEDKRELYKIVLMDRDGEHNSMCRKAVRMDRLAAGDELAAHEGVLLFEDRLQSMLVCRDCDRFCFLPDILYDYRVNPTSTTESLSYETYENDCALYKAELEHLKRENVFTEEDMAAYRSFRIHCFAGGLVRISRFHTSRKNKLEIFRQLRAEPLWQTWLDGGNYDRRELGKIAVVYEAFRRGWDDLVLLVSNAYWRGKR